MHGASICLPEMVTATPVCAENDGSGPQLQVGNIRKCNSTGRSFSKPPAYLELTHQSSSICNSLNHSNNFGQRLPDTTTYRARFLLAEDTIISSVVVWFRSSYNLLRVVFIFANFGRASLCARHCTGIRVSVSRASLSAKAIASTLVEYHLHAQLLHCSQHPSGHDLPDKHTSRTNFNPRSRPRT